MKIERAIEDSRRVMIVGGGAIGVELAPAMASRGIDTKLVNRSDHILSDILDPDMADVVAQYLGSLGVDVIRGVVPSSMSGNEKVRSVTIAGERIKTDVVVFATGMLPETSLASLAGISTGDRGGIIVDDGFHVRKGDEYLPYVLAGGECVEVEDLITGRPVISQLASSARRMAGVIADNLYDMGSTFDPIVNPWVGVAGDLQIGTVGINSHMAKQNGIEVITGSSKGRTKAGYYPGSKEIFIKLLFSQRYLVGAQVIADKGVKERIDGLALAIKKKVTIDDMLRMETCYAPPVSTLVDPVTYAAKDAYKRMGYK